MVNPGETPAPIKPYTAVGLIPTVRGIRKRADIRVNLEHLKHLVKAAAWLSSLVAAGTGIAVLAVNVLSWLWGV